MLDVRPDLAQIGAASRETLAGYSWPHELALIDALPRNTIGEVQKNALRGRAGMIGLTAFRLLAKLRAAGPVRKVPPIRAGLPNLAAKCLHSHPGI